MICNVSSTENPSSETLPWTAVSPPGSALVTPLPPPRAPTLFRTVPTVEVTREDETRLSTRPRTHTHTHTNVCPNS